MMTKTVRSNNSASALAQACTIALERPSRPLPDAEIADIGQFIKQLALDNDCEGLELLFWQLTGKKITKK